MFAKTSSMGFPSSNPHSKMLVSKLSLSKNRASSVFISRIFYSPFSSSSSSSQQQINQISRVLSDYREPRHDIEQALTPFSSNISINLVQQVLKRSKNLGFSAHRFFLWANKIPGFEPDYQTHKILISVLGSSKQFPLIWDFLDQMVHCQKLDIRPDIFWVIFDAYCKAQLPDDAIRAFYRMVDFRVSQDLKSVEQLLYLLCKKKFMDHGQEFFDNIKGKFDVGSKCFTILIRGWGEKGDSVRARKVFDEMLDRGCEVDVHAYNGVIEAMCNGGELEEAYAMFHGMLSKGLKPDAFTFAIFIRSYCKRDNVHAVFRVLDRMKRYGLVPNVFTYNCVIRRLCDNGMVDEAYALLDVMVEAKVYPDTWSYNAIMEKHCGITEVNRASRLLSRMKKAGCLPDKHTYNMLLKMLIRIGRFERAEKVWDAMTEVGFFPSVSTYAVMIHSFLNKNNQVEKACKYFESMVDEGIPPYSTTIEKLRNRLLRGGMMDKVDILAGKMDRSTSAKIKELAMAMRGQKFQRRKRRGAKEKEKGKKEEEVEDKRHEDNSEDGDEEWPFKHDAS